MTPLDLVIARLDAAGCRPRGHHKINARCPAHDDRHPSLSVAEADSGAALIHCHASCTPAAIVTALGLELRDLFPDRADSPVKQPGGLGRDFYIVDVLGENVEAPAKSCDGIDIPVLPPLHKAVLDILHGHAFFAPTCCPSQALIAEQAGCTRETVNRICRDLRDLRLITWTRRRRPGSRWEHNVYQLIAHWHRPYRRAVIARIRAARAVIRARSEARFECRDHTKRTATDVGRDRGGFWRETERSKAHRVRDSVAVSVPSFVRQRNRKCLPSKSKSSEVIVEKPQPVEVTEDQVRRAGGRERAEAFAVWTPFVPPNPKPVEVK